MPTSTANRDPHALLSALNKLEAMRAPGEDDNRRKFQRFVVRCAAELYPMDETGVDNQATPVQLRDLSRTGMGFITANPLDVETTWRITFMIQGHRFGHHPIIVRHCSRVDDELYLVGAQFCIETGLMCLLGVDPAKVHDGDHPHEQVDSLFLPPNELA